MKARKLFVFLIVSILLVSAFMLPLKFVPVVHADALATQYMRYETNTINDRTAYYMNNTQTSSSRTMATTVTGSGTLQVWVGIRAYILFSTNATHELTAGNYNVNVTRTTNGEGIQNVTFVCPTHSLNTTDALYVTAYEKVGTDAWTQSSPYANYVSAQLGATTINGTWTFSLYTYRTAVTSPPAARMTQVRLYWGTSTYNTRLSDVAVFGVALSDDPPTYTNHAPADYYVSVNNESLKFTAKWTAPAGGGTMDKWRFCWNGTAGGSWENSTWTSFGGSQWSNTTKTINAANRVGGWTVKWQIQANTTGTGQNQTTLRYFYYWEIFPSKVESELGTNAWGGHTSFYFNGIPTGGRAATYCTYINFTDRYHYVKAFDVVNQNWTANIKLYAQAPSSDAHYLPAMNMLPDGRIMYAWGYYGAYVTANKDLAFQISTYNAKTQTNLTKLLSNWGTPVRIVNYQREDATGSFCYPYLFSFGTNSSLIVCRYGSSSYNNWVYLRWLNKGLADIYVTNFDDAGDVNWNYVGATPYIDERADSYSYSTAGAAGTFTGNYTFEGSGNSTGTYKNMYVETSYNKTYLRLSMKKVGANDPTVIPTIWNGTSWTQLSSTSVTTTAYTWYSWDVSSYVKTALNLDDVQVKINKTAGALSTQVYIQAVKLSTNITGLAPTFYWINRTSSSNMNAFYLMYAAQSSTADGLKLFLAGELYNVTTVKRRDALFVWTDTYGYTWKMVNGTSYGDLGLTVDDLIVKEEHDLAGFEFAQHVVGYDESAQRVGLYTMICNRSAVRSGAFIRCEILYYNKSLSTTGGSWLRVNMTFANNSSQLFGGQTLQAQDYNIWYYDTYYKRMATWNQHDSKIGFWVASPYNFTKFQTVYYNTTYTAGWVEGSQMYQSDQFYKNWVRYFRVAAGYVDIGQYNSTMLNNDGATVYGYACKFTASSNMTISGLAIWHHRNTNGAYELSIGGAIYSANLLTKLGETLNDFYYPNPGNGWAYGSLTSTISLVTGTSYWLAFKWTGAGLADIVGYCYETGDTNQALNFTMTSTWPSSISSPTYQNRKISCFAYRYPTEVIGLGHDLRYPSYTSVSVNTTIAGAVAKFSCKWSALGLSGFKFTTNNTGTWTTEPWSDPWTGTPTEGWSNVTKTLNSSSVIVAYNFSCNSTSNLWTYTEIYYLHTVKVYSYEFFSTNNITVSSSMLRALLRLQTETLAPSDSSSYLKALIRSLQETETISDSLYKQAALSRLFSEITDSLSTFSSLAAYLRTLSPSLEVLLTYSQSGSYIRGYTNIIETITDAEILKELLVTSVEVTVLETVNGNATVYIWKAKQYSFNDQSNSTDSYNNWKAKLVSNMETEQPVSSQEFYRALSYSNIETGSFSSQLIELKEIVVTGIVNFETIVVTSLASFDFQVALSEDWQNGIVFGLGLGLIMGLSALGLYFAKRRRDE